MHVQSRYSDAEERCETGMGTGGMVLHEIDACRMHQHSVGGGGAAKAGMKSCSKELQANYDVIVFHFPHTGSGIKDMVRMGRTNVRVLGVWVYVLPPLLPLPLLPLLVNPTTIAYARF